MSKVVSALAGVLVFAVVYGVGGAVRAADRAPPPVLSYAPAASTVQSILPNSQPPPHQQQSAAARIEPPRGRVCFNPAETREKIAAHRLAEPFRALRMGRLQGEALRAKLCRWKPDEFVYEIAILRRDGRVVHLYMNALNGQSVGVLSEVDRH